MSRRLPALLHLFVASFLLAGLAAELPAATELVGEWQTAAVASDHGTQTRVVVDWVVGDDWLQLTIEDTGPDGRQRVETLLLRPTRADDVVGFLFTEAAESPLRLEGAWTTEGRLELTGHPGVDPWIWQAEATCEAILLRPGPDSGSRRPSEARLTRLDCRRSAVAEAVPPAPQPAPGAGTTAEGREVGSRPRKTVAESVVHPPAETGQAERDTDEGPAAGVAEIDMAALPAASQASRDSASTSAKVLVAGRGKPLDEVHKAVELIGEFLADRGVAVESPTDEIVVLQAADRSLAYLVREVRDRRAASLLYISAAFGGRERIVVDCYDDNGVLLWREKTVGGTGMRQFKWMNPRLVERIQDQLEPRIGGPGLPVANTDPSR